MTVKLSIGIVVYHPDFNILKKTLEHIIGATQQLSVECYIINNAAGEMAFDNLTDFINQFKLNIKLINNPENTGYGAGNNLAIKLTEAPFHLVLNPDAFLNENALKIALAYMEEHVRVGLLCPRVMNEDGSIQYVHRKDPTLFDMFLRSFAPGWLKKRFAPRMNEFLLKNSDFNKVQDIASPSGCCMLFRTTVLKTIGGFDARYFLYYEDSDIGREVRQIAEVKYLPTFMVTHLWAREAHKSWRMRLIMMKSGWQYFRKWGGCF